MKSKTLFSLVVLTLFTSLIPAGHAQTFSVLYAFTGRADGTRPVPGVTILGDTLYGATTDSCGAAYQLTHSGSNWLFSAIAALPHNCNPVARVVFGPDGHLYGTSSNGGKSNLGTVFKLTPQVGLCKDVACYWTVTDLHDFGPGTDGQEPGFGDLIWDQQGNIYGTTEFGGLGGGTVYELTPSENGYTESVLYNFSGPDGAYPLAGLVFDNSGNLFGTTQNGGSNNVGTVFELTYVMGVGWTEQVLYNFQNASDGGIPSGGLIFDSSGNLYGTTGTANHSGGGTVFELSPSGNTWTFKLLYGFGSDCGGPLGTLSMDAAGNLYGTTYCGGIYNSGRVFTLNNTENGWVFSSLHDFTGGNDGANPYAGVTRDTDGTLYGTTSGGGNVKSNCPTGCGVVWMIKP